MKGVNVIQFFQIKKSEGLRNESGRSMVEILGVLAIIGVLSIGGIVGYRMSMDKNLANGLLEAASKLRVLGVAKMNADKNWCNEMGSVDLEQADLTYPKGTHKDTYMYVMCDEPHNISIDNLEKATHDAILAATSRAESSGCDFYGDDPNASCSLWLYFPEN